MVAKHDCMDDVWATSVLASAEIVAYVASTVDRDAAALLTLVARLASAGEARAVSGLTARATEVGMDVASKPREAAAAVARVASAAMLEVAE